MKRRNGTYLEGAEAEEVLRRAARLQAEESESVEEADLEALGGEPEDGYEVGAVRDAAVDAGIEGRYVDAAYADVRAERSLPAVTKNRALAARFFGGLLDAVTARRTIRVPASEALSTIIDVFPRDPYRLALNSQHGDPTDGGSLVFDIEGFGSLQPPWLAREVSASAVRQVYVSIREISGETPACEVTLRGPIAWSHNLGLAIGLGATAVGGGAGGTLLGAGTAAIVGGLLAGPVGIAATGAAAAVGLFSGGALGRKGYRAFCRYGIEKARRALERMLLAVAIQAEQTRG